MEKSISAVGFTLTEANNEQIEKKLKRVAYAEDMIKTLTMHVKYTKNFTFETTVNFKWGAQAHVSSEDADFGVALNKTVDLLDSKITKEKEKAQEK
ncbi:MAG: HPF/RaiA family ribosome-associated protein [Treponema sp.]|nr:HPF/RaiA family ribosome-associated protein [Treponema sp.]